MNIGQYEGLESEPGIERLFFEIPIGATGAPGTPVIQRGLNKTTPLTRNSAGNYTFNLAEGCVSIPDTNINIQTAAPTTAASSLDVRVVSRTPGGATPNVVIQCIRSDTAAAADPASGDVIYGYIAIKNTNA